MQALRDTPDESKKKSNIRTKSYTRLPKQMPSYIVAFAVHETYDDIATAKQMICNKRSLQGSTSSVSPALSSKTITLDRNSTQKVVDIDYSDLKNETKINIDEENVEIVKNDDVQNELSEIKDYLVVDQKGEEENEHSEMNLVASNKTFDVIKSKDNIIINSNQDDFESIKKPKPMNLKKKRQNQYRVRNVNFKNKKSFKKAENVCKRSVKLKESYYSDSVTKVISRTSLLNSVPAKVNIIETVDSNIISDDENNNSESLQSSPSTTKKSFISIASQDTLREQQSISSRTEHMDSTNSVLSVIKIPIENTLPYKKEVINVSVAVAYNPNQNNDVITKKISEPYRSRYDQNLTSTETLVQSTQNMLMSESTSSETSENAQNMYLQAMNKIDDSDQTLKPNAISENTYNMVGNSSDMDDSSSRSENTLAPNSEMFMFSENLRPNFPTFVKPDLDKTQNRPALLDTVIDMGIFPLINASTSSAVTFNNLNSVFVTGDTGNFLTNPTFKGDQPLDNAKDTSNYIVKKSFAAKNDLNLPINFNLPNESDIKAIINGKEKTESKFLPDEIKNYPSSMTELWDRLVMVVDTAVRRLESSLTEKIIDEMKKSLTVYSQINRKVKDEIIVVDLDANKEDMVTSNNVESIDKELRAEVNEKIQCELVDSQVIDGIVINLSAEGPNTIFPGTTSKSFVKMKCPKIFRDHFEVLKPPAVESAVVEGKGDALTVSTAIASEMEVVRSFNRIKQFLSGPVTCLRENMLVISSVPAFFVAMLFMYGFIVLILKPW